MNAIMTVRHRLPIIRHAENAGGSATARPRTREDCTPCPVCQEWRDKPNLRHAIASNGGLPCGHTTEQAIMHSRPCVFVGCERNTFLDVTREGKIRYNRYGVEPDECEDSCVSDVADEIGSEGASHERIGAAMGITRNGAAVVIERAMRKMRRARRQKRLR